MIHVGQPWPATMPVAPSASRGPHVKYFNKISNVSPLIVEPLLKYDFWTWGSCRSPPNLTLASDFKFEVPLMNFLMSHKIGSLWVHLFISSGQPRREKASSISMEKEEQPALSRCPARKQPERATFSCGPVLLQMLTETT